MNDEYKNSASIGIIGSADGPTSVLITDKKADIPFKIRIKKYLHKCKRRRAEKKIAAGTHTLKELAAYAADTYGAAEVSAPPGTCPASCHIYEIKAGSDRLTIEIDYLKAVFGVSFSAGKKNLTHFRKVTKDLYIYYGVSENDVRQKTERYLSLLNVLSM